MAYNKKKRIAVVIFSAYCNRVIFTVAGNALVGIKAVKGTAFRAYPAVLRLLLGGFSVKKTHIFSPFSREGIV